MTSEKKIFMKCNNNDTTTILSERNLLSSIPTGAIECENCSLKNTCTEWRWRFFNINEKKMVEISKRHPDGQQLFINNNGKWIKYIDDNNWNNFLTKIIYYYAEG